MKQSLLALGSALLLAACGSQAIQTSSTPSPSPSPSPTATPAAAATQSPAGAQLVKAVNFSFDPKTLTVPVGTAVTFRNDDAAAHTFTADGGAFDSQRVGTGETFNVTFSTAGTFAYHCKIHRSMTATITVS